MFTDALHAQNTHPFLVLLVVLVVVLVIVLVALVVVLLVVLVVVLLVLLLVVLLVPFFVFLGVPHAHKINTPIACYLLSYNASVADRLM